MIAKAAAQMSTAAEQNVGAALKGISQSIQKVLKQINRSEPPRVVAIGKWKPVELLQEAYEAGHRHFGENYVQEISAKAPQMPEDTQWHFVGHLQSNKVKNLIEDVPNLTVLETVDSEKLANKLDTAIETQGRQPLKVFVQVNTSGEETKFGVEPEKALELARHIHEQCKHLRFAGLMTIGMPDYTSKPENFECLSRCRSEISDALGLDPASLELSMGMSGDYEQAVSMGSTNVRIGSTIFGARDYENKR